MFRSEVARWALFLWAFNVVDWAVTTLILRGGGVEMNFLLAGWIDSPWGFFVKVILVGLVLWLVALFGEGSREVVLGLVLTSGIYLSIVTWNTLTYLAITA